MVLSTVQGHGYPGEEVLELYSTYDGTVRITNTPVNRGVGQGDGYPGREELELYSKYDVTVDITHL